ncbi:hypothetical protein MTO96_038139 [Rhipicephalus appendiculatus]
MATSAPGRAIRQDRRAKRPQGQADHTDAPSVHSSPMDGPSPESLSSSLTPVRVRQLVALPPQRNRASRDDEPGRRHPDGSAEDLLVQDDRLCIVLWVVGAAFAFPLILSAWLVLVPFVVHANWTTPPPLSLTPQYTRYTVPSTCIVPVTWSTLPPSLNVSAPYSFGPSNESSRPIFCLYNNTRVYAWRNITNSQWDYVFATLPFALCPYVVYWSVGIEDGNLTSRQPSFDEQYGLHRLRVMADTLNFKAVKILLALGGYPEDAPHFSRLGWDMDTMNRLMGDVVYSLDRFGLSGITVHWVEARSGCSGRDDVTVLKTLLYSFRTWFNARMLPDLMITVILELSTASQLVVEETAGVVNHFFLATQNEGRQTKLYYYETCGARTSAMHHAYRKFVSALPPHKLRRSQLCLSDSLSPSAVPGRLISINNTRFFKYSLSDVMPAPLHLECSWPNVCEVPLYGQPCVAHNAKRVTMDNAPDRMFMIDAASEVKKRLDFNGDQRDNFGVGTR